ncbi:defensin-like [Rhodnius prolixus]|uniref:defensin-like n=1 Tax=Rhodnius prolixus TaxID=13249 RepID=UPI003D18CFA3
MKCILSLITLFLVAAIAYSYPAELNLQQQLDDALREPTGKKTEVHLTRRKRVTCDLFSFESQWFTPNHSVCAAHCLTMGYKGGYCQDTICHCRN